MLSYPLSVLAVQEEFPCTPQYTRRGLAGKGRAHELPLVTYLLLDSYSLNRHSQKVVMEKGFRWFLIRICRPYTVTRSASDKKEATVQQVVRAIILPVDPSRLSASRLRANAPGVAYGVTHNTDD